jgi:streptogramin lyase
MRVIRESQIERHLVKQVKAMGGEVRKVQWIGRRGAPDRLVMMPAATIWVELKAPGKKPEAHQLREHERMRKMGQRVEIIDSLEAVEELLS